MANQKRRAGVMAGLADQETQCRCDIGEGESQSRCDTTPEEINKKKKNG